MNLHYLSRRLHFNFIFGVFVLVCQSGWREARGAIPFKPFFVCLKLRQRELCAALFMSALLILLGQRNMRKPFHSSRCRLPRWLALFLEALHITSAIEWRKLGFSCFQLLLLHTKSSRSFVDKFADENKKEMR